MNKQIKVQLLRKFWWFLHYRCQTPHPSLRHVSSLLGEMSPSLVIAANPLCFSIRSSCTTLSHPQLPLAPFVPSLGMPLASQCLRTRGEPPRRPLLSGMLSQYHTPVTAARAAPTAPVLWKSAFHMHTHVHTLAACTGKHLGQPGQNQLLQRNFLPLKPLLYLRVPKLSSCLS